MRAVFRIDIDAMWRGGPAMQGGLVSIIQVIGPKRKITLHTRSLVILSPFLKAGKIFCLAKPKDLMQ